MVTHEPTAEEQLWLEMVNRARSDPDGEFGFLVRSAGSQQGLEANITSNLRFFNVDTQALLNQLRGYDAVAPLAWNSELATSADTHSGLMIRYDQQSHNLPGEPSVGQRVRDAGYDNLRTLAENVFAYVENVLHGHAGFYIDWGYDASDFDSGGRLRSNWASNGDGIQDPAGHRDAMLHPSFTEIGIGLLPVANTSLSVGPFVVTQHIGTRWDYKPMLLGVVIDDTDGDDFYDVGEGMGGVRITAVSSSTGQTYTTTSWTAGGYQLELPNGTYTVTFTGGGLDGVVTTRVTIAGENVKFDAIADEAIDDPNAPTMGRDTLRGTADRDTVDLLDGNDRYDAGDGNDHVRGGAGNDTLMGEAGNDTLMGGSGTDMLYGGDGRDLADYKGETERVLVDLQTDASGAGFARFFGEGAGAGDRFFDIEDARGGDAADNLRGDEGANRLYGEGVSDRIYGRAGDDTLDGGTGADALYGGLGADTMTGGPDAGRMDRFIYFSAAETGVGTGNRDIITDFTSGEDRIEIGRIDADITTGGKQRFDFIGSAAFSGDAGELRYQMVGTSTIVQADLDGDGIADFEIELTGRMVLEAGDFLI